MSGGQTSSGIEDSFRLEKDDKSCSSSWKLIELTLVTDEVSLQSSIILSGASSSIGGSGDKPMREDSLIVLKEELFIMVVDVVVPVALVG